MRKIAKLLCTLLVLAAIAGLISDRRALRENLIRLHVVGATDSAADQAVKLKVKDAIVEALEPEMAEISDMEAAYRYLQDNLDQIQRIANETLENAGFSEKATVTLTEEAFPVRHYDTFSLPSGVYQSLRVAIGAGEGKNWWCVVFPSLCIPAAGENFDVTAAGAGFDSTLSGTLEGEQTYQVRFYLLDLLGKVENFFFQFG